MNRIKGLTSVVCVGVLLGIAAASGGSREILIDPPAGGGRTKVISASSSINGETIFFDDFEAGEGDWWSDEGIWEFGTPTGGPAAAYSGESCTATILGGNYLYGPDSRLVSPQLVLPEVLPGEEILLRFRQWWSYSASDKGYVQIEVYDEPNGVWPGNWEELKQVYAYDAT